MKKNIRSRLPGILITILLTLALTLFMGILLKTQMLPTKYLLVAGAIFVALIACVCALTWNPKRVGAMIAGCLLTMVVLILLMLGTPYLMRAVNMLDSISGIKVEVADVGVYVRMDDPAVELEDAKTYQFGIMSQLDRENADKTIADLEEDLNTQLEVEEFEGLAELVDGLLVTEQVDAIVVNSAYLELLADMEGYEETADQLRELYVHTVETYVEDPDAGKDRWSIFDQFTENEEESNCFTVYISGIDSRSGLIARSRSDVNIIATINPDTRQILLVSTPRDFYVPLPISNGQPDKLTHAGIYGIECSVGTLEMLYGIDIDYYFRVNFSGFERIVDALGGITVDSDYSFSFGGYYFSEGENYLNGPAALAFSRNRKSFASGDRQRGKNQMAVIEGVIDKAMSPAILTNYTDIIDSISGSFETSMPYDKIAEVVRNQLDKGGSWNIVSCSVDGYGDSRKPYSLSTYAYVMVPDQDTVDAAIAKINQVINGEILE